MTKASGAKREVTVGVHEAKTHLSRLLERVAAGDDIVITSRGRVVARIVADGETRRGRVFGSGRGEARLADDFDAPLPADIAAAFE